MSVLDTVGVTPAQLRDIADEVERRWPGAILIKNMVGNLTVVADAGQGVSLAWCDLRFGGVHDFFTSNGEANDDLDVGR